MAKIRAKRLAHTANPLALVAQQQPVYYHQPNPTHCTQSSLTRSQATTRNKGKAIANSHPPIYDSDFEQVVNDEASSKEKEIDKLTGQYDNQRAVNIARARENLGTQVVQQTGIQCYNCKEFGHVVRESDWRDDTYDKPEDQELEAHYMYMAKIQEVIPDATDNSRPIFDTERLQKVHDSNDDYNVFANGRQHPEQPKSVNDTCLVEQGDSSDMSNNGGDADQDDLMV
ncbi:hypothetical protein Tco_1128922 [Tanacetum coccineum]